MIKALLRLVTIWFRYGESESVLVEVEAQLVNTPTKAWLMAIPQLIARLGTKHKELQGLLIDLLKNIASKFPHAIVWPLFTATQTNKIEHQEAAREIMNYICTMSDGTRLVNQAQMVGRELIRTSLLSAERYDVLLRRKHPDEGTDKGRWRQLIEKCFPRNDLMEIAWENVPAMWEPEIARLMVRLTEDSHIRSSHLLLIIAVSRDSGRRVVRSAVWQHPTRHVSKPPRISKVEGPFAHPHCVQAALPGMSRALFRRHMTHDDSSTSTWTPTSSSGNMPDRRSSWVTVPRDCSRSGTVSWSCPVSLHGEIQKTSLTTANRAV